MELGRNGDACFLWCIESLLPRFARLLVVIPWIGWIFGIVWAIVFGLNGERWALQNPDNRYRDEEEFRRLWTVGTVPFSRLYHWCSSYRPSLLFFMIIGAAIFSNMDQLQY